MCDFKSINGIVRQYVVLVLVQLGHFTFLYSELWTDVLYNFCAHQNIFVLQGARVRTCSLVQIKQFYCLNSNNNNWKTVQQCFQINTKSALFTYYTCNADINSFSVEPVSTTYKLIKTNKHHVWSPMTGCLTLMGKNLWCLWKNARCRADSVDSHLRLFSGVDSH